MFIPGSIPLRSQDQCSNSLFQTCGQGLPGNFCCPTNTVCLALASNTTALCCPKGQSCELLYPIPCNIQVQNATAYPDNPLLTTALGADLPKCGTGCCPFGYQCGTTGDDEMCVMAKNQAAYSSLVTQTGQAMASKTLTPTSLPTTTITPTSLTSTVTSIPATNDTTAINVHAGIGRGGIIAGCSVGLAVLIAGVVFITWTKREEFFNYLRRRRPHRLPPREGSPSSQSPFRPPSYQASKPEHEDAKYLPVGGRVEMEVRRNTPRLTLGPFGNNPPFFTTASYQVPPYTPSAELHASATRAEVVPDTSRALPAKVHEALSPVELPASPLSFSLWEKNRNSSRTATMLVPVPPRAAVLPLSRFSPTRKPVPPDNLDNFF
jgi:hypothetical protein